MNPEDLVEFVADANECININFIRPTASTESAKPKGKSAKQNKRKRALAEPFHPNLTYPIFGEQEAIFGYRGLEINLDFYANDLQPSLNISYDEKWKKVGETEAMDVKGMLGEFLPDYVVDPEEHPAPTLPDPTSKSWKPPGKCIYTYNDGDKTYEIYSTSLADPVAREMFRRMQIFVTFYIEGGTQQELDDPDWTMERWTLFLLYEVATEADSEESSQVFTLAGFSTSYRLWVFPTLEIMRATKSLPSPPPSSNGETEEISRPHFALNLDADKETNSYNPLEAPSRERISQFVILPPFQKRSLGARLYNAMYRIVRESPNIYEMTVEDPSESFDDMRDYCDIEYLRTLPAFQKLSLPSSLPAETLTKDAMIPRELIIGSDATLTKLRHEAKMVPRQFNRMVELHLLSTIPPSHRSTSRITRKEKSAQENDRKFYFWRLALKERLFLHNMDQLMQLDKDERADRIEAVAQSVQADYERLLEGLEKRAGWASSSSTTKDSGKGRGLKKRTKQKQVPDEDSAEGADDSEEDKLEPELSVRSKRKRIIDDEEEDETVEEKKRRS